MGEFEQGSWTDEAMMLIMIGFGIIIVILIVIWAALNIRDFMKELDHINNEINRTDGKERKHWKKRKKRLWLSILPFIKY